MSNEVDAMAMEIKYSKYLKDAGMKIPAAMWIAISVAVSVGAAAAIIIIMPSAWNLLGALMPALSGLKSVTTIMLYMTAVVLCVVLLDLLISYPYNLATKRLDRIEEELPDVLKQMGDTLKAGSTYEAALREIAESEYGPIRKEVVNALRKLEEGENFETALGSIAENVDSRLVKRTITIIIDSIRAGAALADVLEEISDDVRATHQILRERRSRTMMQVLFMVAAGGLIAPMIFGFVSTIANVLITATISTQPAGVIAKAERALAIISTSIQVYIIIEILATAVMIALMRDGKAGKSLIYFPYLLFIAYLSYVAAQIGSELMFGGF